VCIELGVVGGRGFETGKKQEKLELKNVLFGSILFFPNRQSLGN
jgi:hypothetical protein